MIKTYPVEITKQKIVMEDIFLNKAIKRVLGLCVLFLPLCVAYVAVLTISNLYHKIKEVF